MSMKFEITQKNVRSTVQETLAGVGIGALAEQAVHVLIPAARMAAPAGMVFGALFSLSRIAQIINDVVGVFFGKIFEFFGYEKPGFLASFVVVSSIYLVRGALAFGVTALLLPGFTLYSGLALTAVIGAVDVISVFTLGKAWMFKFDDEEKSQRNAQF